MFSVVEWVDENALQVPMSMLIQVDGKTTSYWPPTHVANKNYKEGLLIRKFCKAGKQMEFA